MNGDRQARRKPRALARLAALSALVTIALGACATRHNALPPPQEHGRVGVTDQQSAMPGTKQATLGTTRLKRRVKILEHGALAAATSVDEHEAALLAALERALIESGRYEVIKAGGRGDSAADGDAILMAVERVADARVTTVRLHLQDPRSASAKFVFSGEGEPLEKKAGMFIRQGETKERSVALSYAVSKALLNASAVLGSLPWQAPVLKATDDNTVLIPDGKRMGLKPGVMLSIQTREQAIRGPGARSQIAVPGRLVGEVMIVDNDAPGRETMAVGAVVSGSLKGYDPRELVVRFCKPKGYFGHDFGHDRQCGAKAAALVSFDPETALLSFSPEAEDEAEFHPVPHEASPVERPSAVF
jgi:hypothetical protein